MPSRQPLRAPSGNKKDGEKKEVEVALWQQSAASKPLSYAVLLRNLKILISKTSAETISAAQAQQAALRAQPRDLRQQNMAILAKDTVAAVKQDVALVAKMKSFATQRSGASSIEGGASVKRAAAAAAADALVRGETAAAVAALVGAVVAAEEESARKTELSRLATVEINGMRVHELQASLKLLGAPKKGNKSELLARLTSIVS